MLRLSSLFALWLLCGTAVAAEQNETAKVEPTNTLLTLIEQHRNNVQPRPVNHYYHSDPIRKITTALYKMQWKQLLPTLEQLAGTTMFLDPEHEQYYFSTVNPQVVEWATQGLEELSARPLLLAQSKGAYQRFVFREVRIFYSQYLDYRITYDEWGWAREMAADPSRKYEYAERLAPVDGNKRYHLMFWIRRDLDGSMETLTTLLQRAMQVYDPVFLQMLEHKRKLFPRPEKTPSTG